MAAERGTKREERRESNSLRSPPPEGALPAGLREDEPLVGHGVSGGSGGFDRVVVSLENSAIASLDFPEIAFRLVPLLVHNQKSRSETLAGGFLIFVSVAEDLLPSAGLAVDPAPRLDPLADEDDDLSQGKLAFVADGFRCAGVLGSHDNEGSRLLIVLEGLGFGIPQDLDVC
jgi:hypothetical protein